MPQTQEIVITQVPIGEFSFVQPVVTRRDDKVIIGAQQLIITARLGYHPVQDPRGRLFPDHASALPTSSAISEGRGQ